MTIEEKETRKQEMIHHVQAWQQTQRSMQAYCRQVGLSFHALYYWRKKLQHINLGNEVFIPLRIKRNQGGAGAAIEISYPNGVSIKLEEVPDMYVIGQLVKLV
jgi:hypothetical protein